MKWKEVDIELVRDNLCQQIRRQNGSLLVAAHNNRYHNNTQAKEQVLFLTYMFVNIGLQCIAIILKECVQVEHKVQIVPHVVILMNMSPESLHGKKFTKKFTSSLRTKAMPTFPFLSKVSLSMAQMKHCPC